MRKRSLKVQTVRIWDDQQRSPIKLDEGRGYNETLREVIDIGVALSRKFKGLPLREIMPQLERVIDGNKGGN